MKNARLHARVEEDPQRTQGKAAKKKKEIE